MAQSQQHYASREPVRLHMLACSVVGSSRQGARIACIEDLDIVALSQFDHIACNVTIFQKPSSSNASSSVPSAEGAGGC